MSLYRKVLVASVVLATAAAGMSPAVASESSIAKPVKECAELVRDYAVPHAKTQVTSAVVVPATATAPEFCDVRGKFEPNAGFQLKLPTKTYQGRYVQYGCGGFCGFINDPAIPKCGPAFDDAAVAATDDGHQWPNEDPFSTEWAKNDQKARDDLFFRAPHALSKVSKHLIGVFYGKAPKKSYFTGCSNGGREALVLAQRYPHDFDGIIAAAPAAPYTGLIAYQAWLARNTISKTAAETLHAAVMTECDGLDGLVDKQIDEPRRCKYDPAKLAGTLTADEIARAKRLYAGPADHGVRLYPGAQTYGSELGWDFWMNPQDWLGGVAMAAELADNGLKNLVYPIGKPSSSLAEFEFTRSEFRRLVPETVKANSLALDLSEFRRSGGKLIIWHGAADQAIPVEGTLDYWQRLTGGKQPDWARLFVVPSILHCEGGRTLAAFDPLDELVTWVERGKAPEKIIATGTDGDGNPRTRPVFPYPLQAKYKGTGSINDAANFSASPGFRTQDKIRWAGDNLYHRPGPVAP